MSSRLYTHKAVCKSSEFLQSPGIGSDFSPDSTCRKPISTCALQSSWRQSCACSEHAQNEAAMAESCPLSSKCGQWGPMVDPESIRHTPPVAAQWHSRPFGLSPCNQIESSLKVCPLKPEFQHLPTMNFRCMSLVGACSKKAKTIWAGLSLSCLPQASFCTLLWSSETPYLSQLFPRWGNLSSFTVPSWGFRSYLDSVSWFCENGSMYRCILIICGKRWVSYSCIPSSWSPLSPFHFSFGNFDNLQVRYYSHFINDWATFKRGSITYLRLARDESRPFESEPGGLSIINFV